MCSIFFSVAFAAAADIMDAVRSGDAQGRGSLKDDNWQGDFSAMVDAFEVDDPSEEEQPPGAAASNNSALGEGRAAVAPVAVQPLKPSMPDAPAVPAPPSQLAEPLLVPVADEVAVAASTSASALVVAESSALLRDASSLSLVEADPLLETAQETLDQKPDNLCVTSVLETDKDIIDADIGILTGNWGARVGAKKDDEQQAVQQNIDDQLKRCPAQILGLQETCEVTADVLRAPAHEGDPENPYKLLRRAGSEWMVIRVEGKDTLLVACRAGMCKEMTTLHWENRDEGVYPDGKVRRNAVTRILAVECKLVVPVGPLTDTIRVLNVHLHRHVAKKEKGFTTQYKIFWDEIASLVWKWICKFSWVTSTWHCGKCAQSFERGASRPRWWRGFHGSPKRVARPGAIRWGFSSAMWR